MILNSGYNLWISTQKKMPLQIMGIEQVMTVHLPIVVTVLSDSDTHLNHFSLIDFPLKQEKKNKLFLHTSFSKLVLQ